jgi:hypothetical protein
VRVDTKIHLDDNFSTNGCSSFIARVIYNHPMNFLKSPAILLLNCCIVIMLLLSLSMSSAQNLLTHDKLDSSVITLTIDADSNDNDAFEQPALVPRTPSVLYVAHNAEYPPQPAKPVAPNCFPPHDRPPAAHS